MPINSNATKQPKVYRVNLLVSTNELDEALVVAIESAASAAGDPADISKLKSAGLVDRHMQTVLVAALTSYLSL